MKHLVAALLAYSTCLTLAQAQEISLFNGRDLGGWKGLPQFWSVEDGAITATVTKANASRGNTFLVWQGGTVSDFELNVKFRLKAQNPDNVANSGVQFRARISDGDRLALIGYQAELDPGTLHVKKWPEMKNMSGCVLDDPGALLCATGKKSRSSAGHVAEITTPFEVIGSLGTETSVAASYRPNDWNDCRVVAIGNHIQTFINGLPAADLIDLGNRYGSGLLGLQIQNPSAPKVLQFKDITLRHLSSQTLPGSSSANAFISIQTDANQPRIEVIKDQGPNAAEWALTPLDEAIPADIRQNLTFLREDLLDEGKKAAKSSPEAYRLASDYCDKLLTALDQRDLARVNAGYAAAQADANKRSSTQALDARRNHQMSWPQFSREEAQRASLRESEADKADVKKQRLKVEWTTQAVQMRSILADRYRQLREAMRLPLFSPPR